MFYSKSLALAAAAIAAVSAAPVEQQAKTVVMPLKHVSNASAKGLVAKGQARINAINGASSVFAVDAVSSGTVTNEDVSYVAPVVVGSTTYELIVDTGCKSA